MTRMLSIGVIAHFRDAGFGCLGTYRSIRFALGRLYVSFGWRVKR